jgi:AraC-like DNA-binding protein
MRRGKKETLLIMKQAIDSTPDHGSRCQPMNVAFTNGELNLVHGFRLVIPTGNTVVQAVGSDDLGTSHSVLISAPFVAVITGAAQLATNADNDPSGWLIALRPSVLGQVSQDAFGALPKWSESWDPFLREAADTLSALANAALFDAACADAFADVISVHIAVRYGHCAGAIEPDMPITRQMLARIQAFVHDNIAETILVEQLAVLVNMSVSKFARVFKTATGSPPHLYVTLERVKFARAMLCEETIPLVDVGARAGFQTQQHFTDVFHRYTGVTPRAFRLSHRSSGN